MRMAWVLGWAVTAEWFAPFARAGFPAGEHQFFPPTIEALARLGAAGGFDRVVGYSLGAHLLLAHPAVVGAARVALLAPFFAFSREDSLGGRVARTQVRHLARWLRRDPADALADFYVRAGLVPPPAAPGTTEELLPGLVFLETGRVAPVLPAGWRAWCGAEDALLDAAALHTLADGVKIVPGGTHHPAALIRAMAEDA